VLALFPQFEPWLRPGVSRPVSDVVPMAGLRNVLRMLSSGAPAGYVPLGDALCVTDPTFGRGAALALGQAVRLSEALRDGVPARDAVREIEQWLRPWFDDVTLQDTARTRPWRAAVADEPLEGILAGLPPNPFMLLDAADRDPGLADAAGRYVSMLTTHPGHARAARARRPAHPGASWAGRPRRLRTPKSSRRCPGRDDRRCRQRARHGGHPSGRRAERRRVSGVACQRSG
jgi:hypothetical protein